MGEPSADSLSWPEDLTSALPGACAVMVLCSSHASPAAAISKSSLPTCWPLMVMRSFPLSGAKTEGAFAGTGALRDDVQFGSALNFKLRWLDPMPPDAAPLAVAVAKQNAIAALKNWVFRKFFPLMPQALPEVCRPRAVAGTD